jgi:hypothetical protein
MIVNLANGRSIRLSSAHAHSLVVSFEARNLLEGLCKDLVCLESASRSVNLAMLARDLAGKRVLCFYWQIHHLLALEVIAGMNTRGG